MLPTIAIVLVAFASAEGASTTSEPDPRGPASSEPAEPDHAARAGALFSEGKFAEAAAAFREAYESTNDPAFLFGRAQALRRAGNCGAAIEVFEAFIATEPPEADVGAAQDVIEACREILGEPALEAEPIDAEPVTQPVDAEPVTQPVDRSPPRWPRDIAGGVLLGTGLVATIVGGALYGVAVSRTDERMETEQGYEDRQRQVVALGSVGLGVLVTGGALLVGSAVRYALVARSERARRGVEANRRRGVGLLRWRF